MGLTGTQLSSVPETFGHWNDFALHTLGRRGLIRVIPGCPYYGQRMRLRTMRHLGRQNPVLEFPGGWPPRVPAGSPQPRQVASGSGVGRGSNEKVWVTRISPELDFESNQPAALPGSIGSGPDRGGRVPEPWWLWACTMVAASLCHGGRGPGPWWVRACIMVADRLVRRMQELLSEGQSFERVRVYSRACSAFKHS